MMRIILMMNLALTEPILHATNCGNSFPRNHTSYYYFPYFANGKTNRTEIKHVA